MHLIDVPLELVMPFLPIPRFLELRVKLQPEVALPQWKSWRLWHQHPTNFEPVSNIPSLEQTFGGPRLFFKPALERHLRLNLAARLDTLVRRILDCFPPPSDRVSDTLEKDASHGNIYTAYWALSFLGTNVVLHGTVGMPHLATIHEQTQENHALDRILGPTHHDFWSVLERVETILLDASTNRLGQQGQLGISAFCGTQSIHFGMPVAVAAVQLRRSRALICTCQCMTKCSNDGMFTTPTQPI
jgi:hypothetical protein